MHRLCALVDCNHFYASCERLRNPSLHDKPVIVLSNNDGCAIAMSPEAKRLGVRMGTPIFKIRSLIRQHDIHLVSPDFPFYANVSRQVVRCLRTFSPRVEVYSIDEVFMDISSVVVGPLDAWGYHVRETVLAEVGIPTSVGVARTKTLAKVAVDVAKKTPEYQGVRILLDRADQETLLKQLPVADVWGVGRRLQEHLGRMGIQTAWDLAQQPVARMRQRFSVLVAQTVAELNGVPCIDIQPLVKPPKSMMFSRSFGVLVYDLPTLQQILATYARKVCEKLRSHRMVAGHVTIFIRTNKFRAMPQYRNDITIALPVPTALTAQITQAGLLGLARIFQPGYGYHKLGVLLHNLSSQEAVQLNLFSAETVSEKHLSLMQAMDCVNARWGGGTLVYAAEGLKPPSWKMQQGYGPATQYGSFDEAVLMSDADTPLRFF